MAQQNNQFLKFDLNYLKLLILMTLYFEFVHLHFRVSPHPFVVERRFIVVLCGSTRQKDLCGSQLKLGEVTLLLLSLQNCFAFLLYSYYLFLLPCLYCLFVTLKLSLVSSEAILLKLWASFVQKAYYSRRFFCHL